MKHLTLRPRTLGRENVGVTGSPSLKVVVEEEGAFVDKMKELWVDGDGGTLRTGRMKVENEMIGTPE